MMWSCHPTVRIASMITLRISLATTKTLVVQHETNQPRFYY